MIHVSDEEREGWGDDEWARWMDGWMDGWMVNDRGDQTTRFCTDA
jgi:hypothetical protein